MSKAIVALLFFFLVSHQLRSQTQPKEGSSLHYRIIGFSFPSKSSSITYALEIARGNFHSEDSFKKNLILSVESKTNKIVADVPEFGQQYSWRIIYKDGNSFTKSPFYHFSTLYVTDVDTSRVRLRITKRAEKYKDAYVFLNSNRTLYDMNGNPVWFIPLTTELDFANRLLRDLKVTKAGTITFLDEVNAYEINYNGELLWKAPGKKIFGNDTIEHYNHEFVRLGNGHYMVSSTEITWLVPPAVDTTPDGASHNTPKNQFDNKNPRHRMKAKMPFGVLYEFDEKGKLVWSWRSASYFRQSDLVNYIDKDGRPINDVHQNAFFFDEKNQVIYVSYKNIDRILKIKYPGGNVLRSYGEVYKPGIPAKGNGMFCFQHSCRLSKEGYLYLFNNNSCDTNGVPQIVVMQEPVNDKDPLKIIWKFDCPVEPIAEKVRQSFARNPDQTSGGIATELPDGSFFTSLSSPFPKILIVNKDKNILWCALPEWKNKENTWMPMLQYRASIILTRKDLEDLIWKAQEKK